MKIIKVCKTNPTTTKWVLEKRKKLKLIFRCLLCFVLFGFYFPFSFYVPVRQSFLTLDYNSITKLMWTSELNYKFCSLGENKKSQISKCSAHNRLYSTFFSPSLSLHFSLKNIVFYLCVYFKWEMNVFILHL